MLTANELKKIGAIATIWVIGGVFTALYEYFFLANYPGVLQTGPMQEFSLAKNLIAATIGLLVGSLLFAGLEVFYFQQRLKRQKFWLSLLQKLAIYSGVLFFLLIAISFFFNSLLSGRSLTDPMAWQETIKFISSIAFWHPVLPVLILALLSTFLLQLAERFGTDELWKMFTGKYFNPQEEQRIFMFLDLNHSTTLAEQLGNEKFYGFLNDFYHDIAPAIIHHKGEVVEYVGDLVVITWTFEAGIHEAQCITCYQAFESIIEKNKANYLQKYGAAPEFKAAIHCGEVIIGEMGKIKKSIKFSGDVLNTTARVEKVCGKIGAKVAVTDQLVTILKHTPFDLEKVSDMSLKGKKEPVGIFKVHL